MFKSIRRALAVSILLAVTPSLASAQCFFEKRDAFLWKVRKKQNVLMALGTANVAAGITVGMLNPIASVPITATMFGIIGIEVLVEKSDGMRGMLLAGAVLDPEINADVEPVQSRRRPITIYSYEWGQKELKRTFKKLSKVSRRITGSPLDPNKDYAAMIEMIRNGDRYGTDGFCTRGKKVSHRAIFSYLRRGFGLYRGAVQNSTTVLY